jgi:cytochrome P450
VRPAVRSHRRAIRRGAQPPDDLVTHLIGQGCNGGEILGECITFAPAGMITTREFINAAAWHLFTDDGLRERYRSAGEPERIAILTEILRLEPVIGNLRRRTTARVEVPTGDGPATVPAGVLVDISLSSANLDPDAMGARPDAICPARPLADGVLAAGLAFGDGAHKCPGAHLAIQETDIFLHKLFALDGVHMVTPPRVTYKDEVASYDLRGPVVAITPQ